MDKFSKAINEINTIDDLAKRSRWVNNIHPLAKLVLTIWYIVTVVSFGEYNIIGLIPMVVYPMAIFILGEISFTDSVKRLRIMLPLVCLMGVMNPIFETATITVAGREINAGIISMLTLIIKGCLSVFASYLLIATTGIEKICYALRLIKCPRIIVTEILLIYRYISLFAKELHNVSTAYSLRAPKQKGIKINAWGSFAGSVLLRSFDRAGRVFDSMNLRGYRGDFSYAVKGRKIKAIDVIYFAVWAVIFVIFKRVPVVIILGNLIGGAF